MVSSYLTFPIILLDLIDNIGDITDQIKIIFSKALAFIIIGVFLFGTILCIFGVIKWIIGIDESQSKKRIIKGVVLIGISIILGLVSMTFVNLLSF